jgi:aryl-alcohol dehydrogenase-like predicted oxidoreductase
MAHPPPETLELAPGYIVSRIAKGHWQLAARHGPARSVDDAVDDMRRFVEAGITAFDCADHYVGVEDAIGVFRQRHPSLARQVRVSTKVVPDQQTLQRLRKADLEAIVDTSLRRLGVERLDLAQFHWWDYDVPGCTQAMLWLQELQQAGKIAHLGITNFDTAHVQAMLDAGVRLLTHQVQYSLMDLRPARGRDEDLRRAGIRAQAANGAPSARGEPPGEPSMAAATGPTMTALCQAHGIHLLCYGTVAGGFLSERWLGQPSPMPPYPNRSLVKYRLIIEEFGGWDAFQRLLQALQRIAVRHGVDIATVATRWVLDRPQVALALVGARDASHLGANLAVFGLQLDPEERAQLDALADAATGPLGDCYTLERIKDGAHATIMQMNQNTQGAPASVVMAPTLPPRTS